MDDFRVQKSLLSGLNFTVFALGNSLYEEHYNAMGRNLFDWLSKLSGSSVYSLGLGDQNVAQSANGGRSKDFSPPPLPKLSTKLLHKVLKKTLLFGRMVLFRTFSLSCVGRDFLPVEAWPVLAAAVLVEREQRRSVVKLPKLQLPSRLSLHSHKTVK